MAIDLYSKQEELPIWKKALFVFSIVLIFIVLIIFAYNSFVKIPENSKIMNDINVKLNEQGTPEQLKERDLVLGVESKINKFKELYEAKPVFDVFFDKFETWTYPRVYFSSSSINPISGEINLKGQTDSLQSVMQEMLLLDAKSDVLRYTVSNITMGGSGYVAFDLILKVNPALFNSKNEQQ